MGIALKKKASGQAPLLRGRDHMWAVVRAVGVGNTFSVTDIHKSCNQPRRGTVWTFVDRLEKAGIVAKVPGGRRGRGALYRLDKAPAEAPALNAGGRAVLGARQRQMWNILRGPLARAGITARELAIFASTEDAPVVQKTARQYLGRLASAGYLVSMPAARSAKGYRLKPSMNTGPLPPAMQPSGMFDRNLKTVFGAAGAGAVTP
jgi:hypothetical protein